MLRVIVGGAVWILAAEGGQDCGDPYGNHQNEVSICL
jgi:hypothetical protein